MVRRLPIGTECTADGVHFRVWAPLRKRVDVVLDPSGISRPLEAESGGYFGGLVREAGAGTRYRFRLDGGEQSFPDPASRFQPDGPHGPSQVVDPSRFEWSDAAWKGAARDGQVIYEMHIGTFTPEGVWSSATKRLPELADLGITLLEVMPVADFSGTFGWGYDGVNMFAPTRLYGAPDDFRRFVNHAHALGMGVILDVVYNHFGPDGNYVGQFSADFVSKRYSNEWGDAINFDDQGSEGVREFFLANAAYWIDEFHLDGLRLDATQQIFDKSETHILAELGQRVAEAGRGRQIYTVAENETQESRLVRDRAKGGYGLTAIWNDDFHHSAVVALTGHNEAYYTDYQGKPQEFISALKWGFLYQGQWYSWQKNVRGEPCLDVPRSAFVTFLENHDQVANSATGARLHQLTSPGKMRALTALLLLGPATPMLFQGQEFASSKPFLFFADHAGELGKQVCQGRAKFLAQFTSIAVPEMQARLRDPCDPKTFEQSKLDWAEHQVHGEALSLHRELLRLRREDGVFREGNIDGAVMGPEALVLRFFGDEADDRLLLVNLDRDFVVKPAPEPLLAPPQGKVWTTLLSTEEPRFGGSGMPPLSADANWRLPGQAALVLKASESAKGGDHG